MKNRKKIKTKINIQFNITNAGRPLNVDLKLIRRQWSTNEVCDKVNRLKMTIVTRTVDKLAINLPEIPFLLSL